MSIIFLSYMNISDTILNHQLTQKLKLMSEDKFNIISNTPSILDLKYEEDPTSGNEH